MVDVEKRGDQHCRLHRSARTEWQSGRDGPLNRAAAPKKGPPCSLPQGTATHRGSSDPGPMQAGPLWSPVGLMTVTLSWPEIRERATQRELSSGDPVVVFGRCPFLCSLSFPSRRRPPSSGRVHCPVRPCFPRMVLTLMMAWSRGPKMKTGWTRDCISEASPPDVPIWRQCLGIYRVLCQPQERIIDDFTVIITLGVFLDPRR
ncbi:hypothetical protein QBC39DRAFT_37918 [Podospora conica]|nr:hypothetical protein QBC39DRAFT_37918 [Schizothecium conicum]